MGQVKIQVTLRNAREVVMARLGHLPSEQVRIYTTEALVDTGATRLTVPSFVADQLGLIRLGHTDAEYADGRVEEVDTTEGIQIEMLGRTAIRDAMVLGKHVLIGVTVLEDLDLLSVAYETRNELSRPLDEVIAEMRAAGEIDV